MRATLVRSTCGPRHDPYARDDMTVENETGSAVVRYTDMSLGSYTLEVVTPYGFRTLRVFYPDKRNELKANLLVKRATGKRLETWLKECMQSDEDYENDPMTAAYGFGGP